MGSKRWTKLIRFVADEDGQTYFGNLGSTVPDRSIYEGIKVPILIGDPLGSYEVTSETKTVSKLLCPLSRDQVPLIRCVGLNYGKHINEGNAVSKAPKWPTLFIKARTSLANPDAPVRVPKLAQDSTLDYEGELAVVIGKDCKDVPPDGDAWKEFVSGYTVANDVTWRKGQKDFDLSGTQWNFGKGLDEFCPLGPVLVSSEILDPADLSLQLRLNGQTMQETRTSDMLNDVRAIISHFSKGTTLEKGTVILSGTPEGVGYARKPPVHLKNGDELEIEIQGIGILRHGISYD